MSVLVKGVKIPKNCGECPLTQMYEDYEELCAITHEYGAYSSRAVNCPLVEIPPHGDLIDRDEQIERAWRLKLSTRELIEEMLKSAPTIIEAEEGE